MIESRGNYIGGQWKVGRGEVLESFEPSYDRLFWKGITADMAQLEQAITSARKAFPEWRRHTNRSLFLLSYQKKLKEKQDALAFAIARETGKPLWEAKTEVGAMIGKVTISLRAQKERAGECSQENHGLLYHTRHKPHGVIGILGPFNFPGHLPNGHIIPALLAGNTVIFKPSEQTPYVAELMVELWEEIGLPPGVLNLIQGDASIGRALSESTAIDGLLFTGSYHTGSLLMQSFYKTPGRILALEMGGNNPLIVGNIKQIDAAVYQTLLSAFLTAGQRCTCARRLILCRDRTPPEFLNALITATKKIAVAPFDHDPEPFMGSLINCRAAKAVSSHYDGLLQFGAKDILAPNRLKESVSYVTPSLIDITNIKEPDEEIFGPLLHVKWTANLEEAIQEANRTGYGLSAGILSDKRYEYEEVLDKVRAGIINWNTPLTGASSAAPFGGVGKSGNFRPSAYYAADYCNYPVASVETKECVLPKTDELLPGIPILSKKNI